MKQLPYFLISFVLLLLSSTNFVRAQEAVTNNQHEQKIGLNYSFIHFDKVFDPWHLATLSYGKEGKLGYAGLNFNYANRFQQNAQELELETYPKFKKGLYAYIGGATKLSNNSLFPDFRVGFSVYKSLPAKLELEAGVRHLHFANSTNIWVLGLGKYAGNAFINLKSYWSDRGSESFVLSTRFYTSDERHDYWSLNIGTGVSPDDRTQLSNTIEQLKTIRAGADYSKVIHEKSIVKVGFQWINEEYLPDTKRNQLGLNLGFYRRF